MANDPSIPRNVRLRLGNNDIHYGDLFTMTYRWNPSKRVGILHPNNERYAEFDYEDQETQWCYFHEQNFKGLWVASWDEDTNRPYFDNDLYKHDPLIQGMDPYLIQRVSTLIMNDMVDFHIVRRYPTTWATPIIQAIFSVFISTSKNGQKIGGIWDD